MIVIGTRFDDQYEVDGLYAIGPDVGGMGLMDAKVFDSVTCTSCDILFDVCLHIYWVNIHAVSHILNQYSFSHANHEGNNHRNLFPTE